MTTKEATQFIMKKYEVIKNQRTQELRAKLTAVQKDDYDKKEKAIDKLQKDLNEIAMTTMKAIGFENNYDSVVTINRYGFYGVESKSLKDQITRIELEVEKERNRLIDKAMLLGVKNQSIKDILAELMEKTQD